MVLYNFNPSTQQRQVDFSEFEASLVYIPSPRLGRESYTVRPSQNKTEPDVQFRLFIFFICLVHFFLLPSSSSWSLVVYDYNINMDRLGRPRQYGKPISLITGAQFHVMLSWLIISGM